MFNLFKKSKKDECESSTTCERGPWNSDDIANYEMFEDKDELKRLHARKKFFSYWPWGYLGNINVLAKIALEQIENEIAEKTKKPKKTTKPKKSVKKAKGS